MSTATQALCTCTGNFNNLGVPGCLPLLGAPKRFWIGETFNADGTRKTFDPSTLLDLAYFDTILKAEDPQNRVFPADTIKTFASEKEDPTTEDAENGSKRVIRDGVVTHTATYWVNDPFTYKALWDSWKCKEISVWTEDTLGNILGEATADGKLAGRRVEVNSMVSVVTDPNNTVGAALVVTWSYELASGDGKVSYISANQLASDFAASDAKALLDVEGEFVGVPELDGGSYKLFLLYGPLGEKIPVTGWGVTNIEGFNENTPASVTLLTFTDALVDGTYTYTHSAQTATNVLHMQGVTTTIQKIKYDTKLLNAVTGIMTAP